jgi:hypothetical protein
MQDDIGLETKPGSDILWILKDNPELTFYERVRRRLILQEVATALRLPMSRNTAELNQMINSIELHRNDIDEFFGTRERAKIYSDSHGLTGYDDLLMPPDIQQSVKAHIDQHPEYVEQILKQHANIADDIQFDNDAYTRLKEMIL